MPWLEVRDLHVAYGARRALQGVSLSVEPGQVACIVGANGAGKSTLLKALMGVVRASGGSISLAGKRLDRLTPPAIVKAGLAIAPEGRRLFPEMTVLENLMTGAYQRSRAEALQTVQEVFGYFPILQERQRQQANSLSGGQQQMATIGRALMSRPRLLLLDEPSLGLSPLMVAEIAAIIERIHAAGISVVLVEQNARMALEMSDIAYVMQNGRVTLHGTGSELLGNDEVQRSYLGL